VETNVEPDRPQMTIEYDACKLHAGRLQTHTQNMLYLSILYWDNGWANAPHFYVCLSCYNL